jgi:hypothetical protein
VIGKLATAALLAALIAAPAAAQDGSPAVEGAPVTLPRTETRLLPSDEVHVEYKLYVSLPRDYAYGDRHYPVAYLLDADYSFAIARNTVEHLSDRGNLEPLILVGIAYGGPDQYRLNRTRDYTPAFQASGGYGPEVQQVSGGAPRFADFIEKELIPFVDAEYRTTDERALVGHSFGGLFASWVLLTRPEIFSRYVIASPSLWYADHMMAGVERAWAADHDDLAARIYMGVGSREVNDSADMVGDLRAFTRSLGEREYPSLALRWMVFDDETHNSVFPALLGKGLRYVFAGW